MNIISDMNNTIKCSLEREITADMSVYDLHNIMHNHAYLKTVYWI